ncbi:DUF222 domain-containing protein [Rathayibacter sp. VKM Ac-2760]|nr:DUF222 domain-containing protein [Rathayibacter sp. VKM Ac-2760]
MKEDEDAAALAEVRDCFDDSAADERSTSPTRLRAAERLHRGYRLALTIPEAFARGASRSETRDLVERSVRAELAVAYSQSEREVSRRLEIAQMLMEHLPLTRVLLRDAKILWEVGEAICRTASSLPEESRTALDERAADEALTMTTAQLRRALSRWREELHEQPLAERHARAREDRAVWVTPEVDGMATLCLHAPAPAVTGAYDRLRRIARTLRDEGDLRTLQQLSADAAVDLLCDGDITGTTPDPEHREDPTFVPGLRAEVRLTLARPPPSAWTTPRPISTATDPCPRRSPASSSAPALPSPGFSPTRTPGRSSPSEGPGACPRRRCASISSCGTRPAGSPAAPAAHRPARPITRANGATAARPHSRTWCRCAPRITTCGTGTNGATRRTATGRPSGRLPPVAGSAADHRHCPGDRRTRHRDRGSSTCRHRSDRRGSDADPRVSAAAAPGTGRRGPRCWRGRAASAPPPARCGSGPC